MYAVSNNEGIGWGATPDHDGATALQHSSITAVRNTSMEVREHKFPDLPRAPRIEPGLGRGW